MEIKMTPCSRCGNDMPEIRKIKFGYDFCVKCSEAGLISKRRAIIVQKGTGDHTWVETIFVDDDEYKVINKKPSSELYNEFEEE